jgi:hypothetical protein
VWWLAVAGRIDHRVGRLAPHAKALARCCLHGVWLRLALVMVVVVWHSKRRRVRLLLLWLLVVGWRSLVARWAAALARGWQLAAVGLAQPHAPPVKVAL